MRGNGTFELIEMAGEIYVRLLISDGKITWYSVDNLPANYQNYLEEKYGKKS